MKKILLLALPLMVMCAVSCEKDKGEEWTDDSPIIQFKDPKFLEAVLDCTYSRPINHTYEFILVDKNNDGQISEKEASIFEEIRIYEDEDIRNMDEIKYFTSLTFLTVQNNHIQTLDLSNNTALTRLTCYGNQLTSLDLSENTALTYLECSGNQLTTLDVSNNTALTILSCTANQLTSLDVSKNTDLQSLLCYNNQLTELDLSNNKALKSLDCKNNPLQKLILYKYHRLDDSCIESIEEEYGDIIEYVK